MTKKFTSIFLLLLGVLSSVAQSLTEVTNLRFYEHHSPTIVAQPGGGGGFNGVQSGYDFVNHTYYPSVSANGPHTNGEEANIDMVEHDGPGSMGGAFGFTSGVSSIWNGQIKANSQTMWVLANSSFDYSNSTDVSDLVTEYNNGTPAMHMGAVADNDVYIGKIRNSSLYVAVKCYNVTNNPWTGGMPADVFFDFDYKYGTASATIPVTSIAVEGQGGATEVNAGSTLQMEAVVLPTNATDNSITWSLTLGTGNASIDVNGLLTGISVGSITVIATANDGSGVSGSTTIEVMDPTDISDHYSNDLVAFYPNPVTENLFVDVQNNSHLSIYNLTGKLVWSSHANKSTSINVSTWSKGLYLLKVKQEEKEITKKFAVE